jgi:hypothetical protein
MDLYASKCPTLKLLALCWSCICIVGKCQHDNRDLCQMVFLWCHVDGCLVSWTVSLSCGNNCVLLSRAAAQRWNGEGSLLLTSSSAVYDVSDNSVCDEVPLFLLQQRNHHLLVILRDNCFSRQSEADGFSTLCGDLNSLHVCDQLIIMPSHYCASFSFLSRYLLLLQREGVPAQICSWMLKKRCSKLEGMLYAWLAYIYPHFLSVVASLFSIFFCASHFSVWTFMNSFSSHYFYA